MAAVTGTVTKVAAGRDEASGAVTCMVVGMVMGTVVGMGMTAGAQCENYMYLLYSKE